MATSTISSAGVWSDVGSLTPPADARLPLTGDAVTRITAIVDPAVRNVWITESYADLGRRLLGVLGTDQTWCSFATWASNTAGVSIRGHELPHVLDRLLVGADEHVDSTIDETNSHAPLLRWVGLIRHLDREGVHRLVRTALTRVSDHIAHGNTLVYGELAPLFVRFVERLEGSAPPALHEIDNTLEAIGVPTSREHPLINLAFWSYAMAATTSDDGNRAQYVLTANVAAVLHEQQRLQDDIAAALDAGLIDAGEELDQLCHHLLPGPIRRWAIAAVRHRVALHVDRLWEHVATQMLMTMSVPGETLHLGRDVPCRPDGSLFPADLNHLDHPALCQLLDAWDRTKGTGHGSGAENWADLHQRMGYIVNLFRSRQQSLDLTDSPFTSEQLASMERDELPSGL